MPINEADASCSLSCITLSFALLVSSILRTATSVLWWVDGVTAVIIAILIARESYHTVLSARQGVGACGCESSSSVVIQRLFKRLRTGNGDLRSCVEWASAAMADSKLTRSGGEVVSAPIETNPSGDGGAEGLSTGVTSSYPLTLAWIRTHLLHLGCSDAVCEQVPTHTSVRALHLCCLRGPSSRFVSLECLLLFFIDTSP